MNQNSVVSIITGQPSYPEFEVYRPPPASHRLELRDDQGNVIPREGEWKPSISYKAKLRDIKEQFTPAEYFKYRLQTSGKHIRMIQRLENRWKKDLPRWNQAACKVQAAFKGMKSRRFFETIKDGLMLQLRQRRLTEAANKAFSEGDYVTAAELTLKTEIESDDLTILQMKAYYRLKQYTKCINSANELLKKDPRHEEAAYFKACAFTRLQQFDDAITTLRDIMSIQKESSNDMFSLYAALCYQITPPDYEGAIDTFTELIHRDPRDFEALYQRACCYSCLQEWTSCLKDLTTILAFKPTDKKVLMMRARMFTCQRKWDLAKKDYQTIIRYHPSQKEEIMSLIQAIEPFKQNALDTYWEKESERPI